MSAPEGFNAFCDLLEQGTLIGSPGTGQNDVSRVLQAALTAVPSRRAALVDRYEHTASVAASAVYERVIAPFGGREALLAMVRRYGVSGREPDGVMHIAVRATGIGHHMAPDGRSGTAFGIDATRLRSDLFALIDNGDAISRIAMECLTNIDALRLEYGQVDSEPHHPDLARGGPWPRAAP